MLTFHLLSGCYIIIVGLYSYGKGCGSMKKIFSIIVLTFLFIVVLAGCSQPDKKNEVTESFTDKKWVFYDEVIGEHLCLNLGSDGTYSYHCQCGEPVGDSDLFESYEYDSESGVITLFNDDDNSTDQIEVIDYNEYHLMVKIDGELKDFVLCELDNSTNFYAFEGESYLSGYNSRCVVVDIQEDKIIYGPNEYDPEGPYQDGPFEEYELAENVPVFDLSISRYMSIQEDQEYEEFYDVAFTELEQEEIQFILDSGAGSAFLWFDDELRVEKIVFYGELSVTADYISVIVPEELVGETTQEYLDTEVEEGIYDAAHLNEDGSVIYLMMAEQYDFLIEDMKSTYMDSVTEMCDEELYGIVDIEAEDDFSSFKVMVHAGVPLNEKLITENLTYMGKMYAAYTMSDVEEIEVIYVNSESGETIK